MSFAHKKSLEDFEFSRLLIFLGMIKKNKILPKELALN